MKSIIVSLVVILAGAVGAFAQSGERDPVTLQCNYITSAVKEGGEASLAKFEQIFNKFWSDTNRNAIVSSLGGVTKGSAIVRGNLYRVRSFEGEFAEFVIILRTAGGTSVYMKNTFSTIEDELVLVNVIYNTDYEAIFGKAIAAGDFRKIDCG